MFTRLQACALQKMKGRRPYAAEKQFIEDMMNGVENTQLCVSHLDSNKTHVGPNLGIDTLGVNSMREMLHLGFGFTQFTPLGPIVPSHDCRHEPRCRRVNKIYIKSGDCDPVLDFFCPAVTDSPDRDPSRKVTLRRSPRIQQQEAVIDLAESDGDY